MHENEVVALPCILGEVHVGAPTPARLAQCRCLCLAAHQTPLVGLSVTWAGRARGAAYDQGHSLGVRLGLPGFI
jgi:hypothetical protein